MTTISNPAELRKKGTEVLVRELGYANAMRFLLLCETGFGDYTRDRDQFLPADSVDELVRQADELVRRQRN